MKLVSILRYLLSCVALALEGSHLFGRQGARWARLLCRASTCHAEAVDSTCAFGMSPEGELFTQGRFFPALGMFHHRPG